MSNKRKLVIAILAPLFLVGLFCILLVSLVEYAINGTWTFREQIKMMTEK